MSSLPPPYPQPDLGFSRPIQTGPLTSDTPCRKCGYNLRGLGMQSRCPECGTPVGLSVHGDLLRFSNPAWVRTLRTGVRLILWSIVAAIFGAVAMAVLQAAAPGLREVTPAIGFAASLIGIIGAWKLTEPDPSGIGEDRYGTSRRIIRIAIAANMGASIISWVTQTVVLPPNVRITFSILAGIAGLCGVVGQFAQLNYISKLALRIPDDELSKRARFLMWAIGISYATIVIAALPLAIIAAASAKPNLAAPLAVVGCFAGIAFIALIIFGIMYLLMLEKLSKRFGEQAAAAELVWSHAESGAAGA